MKFQQRIEEEEKPPVVKHPSIMEEEQEEEYYYSSAFASLPFDIALKIASCLSFRDVCVLGSCSKFWMDICGSDLLWTLLFRGRWPYHHYLVGLPDYPSSDSTVYSGESNPPLAKGGLWRSLYIAMHEHGRTIWAWRPTKIFFFSSDYIRRQERSLERFAQLRREMERLRLKREFDASIELLRSGRRAEAKEMCEISKTRRDQVKRRNLARRNISQCVRQQDQQKRTKKMNKNKSCNNHYYFARSRYAR